MLKFKCKIPAPKGYPTHHHVSPLLGSGTNLRTDIQASSLTCNAARIVCFPYRIHFLYNITLSCWLSFRPMQHAACHSSLPYALHPLIIDKQSTCKANNGTAVGFQRFSLYIHENRGLELLCFGTLRCVYW